MTANEGPEQECALAPYRVLDLSDERGFLCGKILGDFGADVIKVEPPRGDPSRRFGPFYHDIPHPEKSLFWFAYNTNKRGITLNIGTADGQEILKKLVKSADFVIESFPPGYMERWGLGYEALSRMNPRIILISITPFGQTGPYASYKASDLVGWGMGGILYLSGDADRPPLSISIPQAYMHAAAEAAVASMIALWHREQTGEGQHVDVSMQACIIRLIVTAMPFWDLRGRILKRSGWAWVTPRVTYPFSVPCKDGYMAIVVFGGANPSYLRSNQAIVAWMDEEGMAPAWLKELDWVHDYEASRVSQGTIDKVTNTIAQFFMTKTKTEIYSRAVEHGIFATPVSTTKDLRENDQLQARNYWLEIEHPELGDNITYPGAYVKATGTPFRIRQRAPLIGEHNSAIYEGELGISRDELIALRQANII